MASGHITSWQIEGEKVKVVTVFLLGSRITVTVTAAMKSEDNCFLAGKLTNLDNVLKNRDITLLTKVHIVMAVGFPWSCMVVRAGL